MRLFPGGVRLAAEVHVEPSTASSNGSSADASVAAALERLDRRLARIEESLADAKAMGNRAPPLVGALVDSLDDAARRAQDAGADLDERAATALKMLERLTEPKSARALEQLLGLAEAAPAAVGMAVDTMDALCQRTAAAGIDLDSRAKNLLVALEKLTSPAALRVLQDLLDRVDVVEGLLASGILDPAPVAIVSRAGQALAFTGRESPPPVGPWGALRALKDADIQRALGFALRFAQRFGRSLGEESSRPALPSTND
jgi:uncharacterized protein YjgD (DUF1641 family)